MVSKTGRYVEKLAFISIASGHVNWYDSFEKQVENMYQEPYETFPFPDPIIAFLRIWPKEIILNMEKDAHWNII